MRKLLLVRHAKSSWKYPELDDHERPLNKRGERDVLTMSRHLAEKDEALDVIFSSTATRALDYAQSLSEFTHVNLNPDLSFYTFDVDQLLEILRHLPDSAHNVAVIAHNPAITQAVNRLSNSEISNVPTAAIACLSCEVEQWMDLGEGVCGLEYFVSPKMLR